MRRSGWPHGGPGMGGGGPGNRGPVLAGMVGGAWCSALSEVRCSEQDGVVQGWRAWNGSWNGSVDNPSAASAVSAIRAIYPCYQCSERVRSSGAGLW
jgi:hypothetical protein